MQQAPPATLTIAFRGVVVAGDNSAMKWQRLWVMLGAVALGAGAWRAGGWAGLALLGSGLVLWFLLHYHRLLTVMKRANERPSATGGSAVMLHAKLRQGLPLLHVMALTQSLGERLSAPEAQPEVYRWSDPGQSHVVTEFEAGRLVRWRLERPADPDVQASTPEAH